jgi:hypothetical protein
MTISWRGNVPGFVCATYAKRSEGDLNYRTETHAVTPPLLPAALPILLTRDPGALVPLSCRVDVGSVSYVVCGHGRGGYS